MNLSAEHKRQDRILVVILYILFPLFGLFDAAKGTLALTIKDSFGINYTALGALITIGTLGWVVACFFGGIIAERKGSRPVIITGLLLSITGMILMRFVTSYVWACVLLFTIYLGLGCFEIGSSVIASLNLKHGAIFMSLLVFAYSAGNIAGPVYATWLVMAGQTWQQIFSYLAIPLFACLALVLVISRRNAAPAPLAHYGRMDWGIFRSKFLWFLIILLGMAVVVEFGMVNWLVNYLEKVTRLSLQQSSSLLSVYFMVSAAGRLAGGFITHKFGWQRTLVASSILMLAMFILGILLGTSGVWFLIAFGFFSSILFPTTLFAVSKIFRQNIIPIMGIVIATASSINLLFSYLIGFTSDQLGALYGFSLLGVCSLLAVIFILVVVRLARAKPAAASD